MTICRLVYMSARNLSVPLDLDNLIQKSRENNARVGVTGFLLFDGTVFAQCLEGSRSVVTHTYNRITTDMRHYDMHLISCIDVQERLFGEWSMGLLDRISPAARERFLAHFTIERVHPENISADRLLFFLQTLAAEVAA